MRYLKNEIPKCPHCGEDINTYVDEETPLGVQNLALHRKGEVEQIECDSCYEWFDVETRGNDVFVVTEG